MHGDGETSEPVTTLSVTVVLAVLGAGLLHAVWNALAKGLSDVSTNFALLNVGVLASSVLALPFVGLAPASVWRFVLASVAVHTLYELVLMSAYQASDFSRSYPIARGVAPLLVSLGGVTWAHEHLGTGALVGIGLITLGVTALAVDPRALVSRRGVVWALATGVCIASYTLIDGVGARHSHHVLAYAATLFFFQSILWLIAVTLRRRRWLPRPTTTALGITSGVVSMAGYGIVLWAQTRAALGTVSALRETGVVWAALFGVVFFREGRWWRLVLPAAVVALGVALLAR